MSTGRRKMFKILGYLPRASSFNNILTCPICTQDKPAEKYIYREIVHILKHVLRVFRGDEGIYYEYKRYP